MEPYRRLKRRIKRTWSGQELKALLSRTGKQFDSIPRRREGTPLDLKDVRAACILDDITERALRHEITVIPIDPERWFEPFMDGVDLLLIESFWNGCGGRWESVAFDYNVKEREMLRRIVRWCRKHGTPTVFWNKEDPVHFDEFIDLALEFDHIFTTDAGCLPRYQERGKEAQVLMFAAQPAVHNPLEICQERVDRICFAGSWIAFHQQRNGDLERMVDAFTGDVDIYDRNFGTMDRRYAFPPKFEKIIKGTLRGDDVLKAYKGYRFGLNVNTVKGSPSMVSRRTFELMACNTPVVSNDSLAMRTLFGDLTISSDDPSILVREVASLRSDENAYRRLRLRALRGVMLKHTYRDRMAQVMGTALGMNAGNDRRKVVCLMKEGTEGDRVRIEFERQTCPEKELIIIKDLGTDIASRYARAIEEGALLVILHSEDHYGDDFLGDMASAFMYSDAAMVTKLSHRTGDGRLNDDGNQYRWVKRAVPGALVVDPKKVTLDEAIKAWSFDDCIESRCLCLDEFNYIKGCSNHSDLHTFDA